VTRVVIQCRTNSRRLPGKAFLTLSNIPSVVLCAKRAANLGAEVVVATSDHTMDDALVSLLEHENIAYVRGSLENVLSRYCLATEDLELDDSVVRLTADNVFVDGEFIQSLIHFAAGQRVQYCTTDCSSNGFPYGLGAEYFTVNQLRLANRCATSPYEIEHVTPWMKANSSHSVFVHGASLQLSERRCTLDTLEDYLSLRKLFDSVDAPLDISWQKLCSKLSSQNLPPHQGEEFLQPKKESISRFTLGGAQIGMIYGVTERTQTIMPMTQVQAMMSKMEEFGINCIDTARGYGVSEQRIGQAHQSDRFHVVTKLDPSIDDTTPSESIRDIILKSVNESCRQLGRTSLPIFLLHRYGQYQNKEIFNELVQLKQQGILGELGLSVSSPEEAIEALRDPVIKYLQIPFNVLDWRWKTSDFQSALAHRKEVFIFTRSAFLQGILVANAEDWPRRYAQKAPNVISQLRGFVDEFDRENRIDLCLAYIHAHAWVDSIVVGCQNVPQLKENFHCFQNTPLSDKQVEHMDRQCLSLGVNQKLHVLSLKFVLASERWGTGAFQNID